MILVQKTLFRYGKLSAKKAWGAFPQAFTLSLSLRHSLYKSLQELVHLRLYFTSIFRTRSTVSLQASRFVFSPKSKKSAPQERTRQTVMSESRLKVESPNSIRQREAGCSPKATMPSPQRVGGLLLRQYKGQQAQRLRHCHVDGGQSGPRQHLHLQVYHLCRRVF